MNIWNGIDSWPRAGRGVVASIGNYDGVHLGHQAILRRVVEDAESRHLRALLISFDPHPTVVVAPERRARLLQTRRQKLDSLEALRLSDLLLIDFTSELAELGGEEFFSALLAPHIDFETIHVGENFRFGHRRSGDLALLRRIGQQLGFDVHGMPAMQVEGRTVSSSAIREAVEAGDVEQARCMLGRPFALTGEIVHGAQRGRVIDFPTANLAVENEMLPRPGVYITETLALAARQPSMTNVGVRPTFGGRTLTVESHLLEFSGDLYGQRAEVRFLARLRDEMNFAGLTELADQLSRDRAATGAYFQNMQLGFR